MQGPLACSHSRLASGLWRSHPEEPQAPLAINDVWFADPNGTPDHRRHLTKYFAEEIRGELRAGGRS